MIADPTPMYPHTKEWHAKIRVLGIRIEMQPIFNPDPHFFKLAVEWCMLHIGPHGTYWYLEEYNNLPVIVLTSNEDLLCFKISFPQAYVGECLYFRD